MSPALVDHTDSPNPQIDHNTNPIQTVADQLRRQNPNLSQLAQQFYQQMQAHLDPPLESIWAYAALAFRSRNRPKDQLLDRISAAKDLFQLTSSCSAACGGSKSVALLAPVVRMVHDVVLEAFKVGDLKREKKVVKEVKCLVGVILGHMNVCCCGNNGSGEEDPVSDDSDSGWCLESLSSVWLDGNEGLGKLVPLVSEDVVCVRDGDVDYLAGVVIAELFLLKLCLDCKAGVSETELRTWAVGSITGFQSIHIFEVLLRMLLEITLPVTSLIGSEGEVLLRKVLYDAIILVEYSFLNPEKAVHIPEEHMKIISMRRLIVSHEAVEYFREHGDQRRALSYTTAFASSLLCSQIVKWAKNQFPLVDSTIRSNGTSPQAIIKWLLNLEGQGFLVLGDSILKFHVPDIPKSDFKQLDSKSGSNEVDDDIIFYEDNKRRRDYTDGEDEKVNQCMSAAFVAAAHTMKSVEKRGKKRKGEYSGSDDSENSENEDENSLSDDGSE